MVNHTVIEQSDKTINFANLRGLLLRVISYDEQFDTFEIQLDDASPSDGQRSLVPAILLPYLVGEFGEPDEFLGRAFELIGK